MPTPPRLPMMFAATATATAAPLPAGPERPGAGPGASSDAAMVGWWLLGAAGAAYALNQLIQIFQSVMGLSRSRRVESTEGGLMVRPALEHVTTTTWSRDLATITARLDAQDRALQEIRSEVVLLERRLVAANEERSSKLHERLNTILVALGELRGQRPQAPPPQS